MCVLCKHQAPEGLRLKQLWATVWAEDKVPRHVREDTEEARKNKSLSTNEVSVQTPLVYGLAPSSPEWRKLSELFKRTL